MPDPRQDLTAQDFTYAATALRALARRAEGQATDLTFHASRETFGEAVKTYDELAAKRDRIAKRLSAG
jgi:hypothetical protein